MPKTSKRKNSIASQTTAEKLTGSYRTAIYARLSSDQEKKAGNKSAASAVSKQESVEIQIAIAQRHIETLVKQGEKMEVCGVYCDMGKTGTNFSRDEFARMMQDIRMGEINCVVVKDLSRFGRNYLEVGNYIEKILPFLGVRFIAVSDGFDTGREDNKDRQMSINIKNLVNDMYAKDFSKKAKIQLKQRRDRGNYVGGPAPYGYTAKWVGKNRELVVEQPTKPVVEMIFALFLCEKSYAAVVNKLNTQRINPPVVYKKTGAVFCAAGEDYKGWDRGSVERILNSTTYMGTLTQGKTSCLGREEASRVKNGEADWVIAENTHEAIIGREDFEQTQGIIAEIRLKSQSANQYTDRLPLSENIFDDTLFCGSCGRKLTRRSCVKTYKSGEEKRLEYFDCATTYSTKTDTDCGSNRISREMLAGIVFSALRAEFQVYLKKPKYYLEKNEENGRQKKKEYQAEIIRVARQLEQMEQAESRLYMRYREGEIGQEQYTQLKLKNGPEKEVLHRQRETLEDHIRNLDQAIDRQNRAIRNLLKLKQPGDLTREFINSVIDKIYVYPGKRVEIVYSFCNEIIPI